MCAALRDSEKRKDLSMTVRDLIEVYHESQAQKKSGTYKLQAADDKSLNWNQFVKDFSKDPRSSQFKNRLKVAAQLWKTVREAKTEDRRYKKKC